MTRKRPLEMIAMACLVALFVAVRMWHLTDSCLWFDEIFSVHAAEQPWGQILNFVAADLVHPPLFYIFLKLWIAIGGESIIWLRIFPVVFSVVSIFPLVSLLRELKLNTRVQLICLFLLAFNGILLRHSQVVRMYSLLMCFGLFSMWLFARYFFKGKNFIPLVIVNILLVYTHYFGWLVVGSEVSAILIFQRIKWRRITVMLAVVFVSFTPWIYAVWSAAKTSPGLAQNIGRTPRPGVLDLTILALNLVEPFYSPATTIDPISLYSISIPLLLITILVVGMYLFEHKRFDETEKRVAYLLGLFVVFPVIAAFVASWILPHSVWGSRHLIAIFAPLAILIAIALTKIPAPKLRIAFSTIFVLFVGYAFALALQRPGLQPSWCAWQPFAVQAANERLAKIYVFEDLIGYHFWFALEHNETRPVVAKIRNIEGVREDLAFFLPRAFDGVKTIDISEVEEQSVWIAYRASRIDVQQQPLKSFIDRGYKMSASEVFVAQGENAFLVLLEK
ncbi:MAG: glycosyltransferase family 39 protein [Chloracidobacterium sp.]|nr:glycosyltransferase family 39 protein [Chloracidobacterium sp.]